MSMFCIHYVWVELSWVDWFVPAINWCSYNQHSRKKYLSLRRQDKCMPEMRYSTAVGTQISFASSTWSEMHVRVWFLLLITHISNISGPTLPSAASFALCSSIMSSIVFSRKISTVPWSAKVSRSFSPSFRLYKSSSSSSLCVQMIGLENSLNGL